MASLPWPSKISEARSAQGNVIGLGTATSRQLCQRCSDQISRTSPNRRQHTAGFEHQYQRQGQAAYTGVSRSKRAVIHISGMGCRLRDVHRRRILSSNCVISPSGSEVGGNSWFYGTTRSVGSVRPDQPKGGSKRATRPTANYLCQETEAAMHRPRSL